MLVFKYSITKKKICHHPKPCYNYFFYLLTPNMNFQRQVSSEYLKHQNGLLQYITNVLGTTKNFLNTKPEFFTMLYSWCIYLRGDKLISFQISSSLSQETKYRNTTSLERIFQGFCWSIVSLLVLYIFSCKECITTPTLKKIYKVHLHRSHCNCR